MSRNASLAHLAAVRFLAAQRAFAAAVTAQLASNEVKSRDEVILARPVAASFPVAQAANAVQETVPPVRLVAQSRDTSLAMTVAVFFHAALKAIARETAFLVPPLDAIVNLSPTEVSAREVSHAKIAAASCHAVLEVTVMETVSRVPL